MIEDWHIGLTERRRRFCEAYAANGGNGTAAATVAGFRSPEVEACRLLKNSKIVDALEKLRKSTTDEAILTREGRQKLWSQIALDETEDTSSRLRASELLGRAQGDFLDRVETSHSGNITFNMVMQTGTNQPKEEK